MAAATTLAAACALASPAAGAPAGEPHDVTTRFQTVGSGSIHLHGNTLLACAVGADPLTCVAQPVDVDGDPATTSSSKAELRLGPGESVRYAALSWSGTTVAGTGGVDLARPGKRDEARLTTPTAPSARVVDDDGVTKVDALGRYLGFADVTEAVKAGGSGTYAVADVQTATGAETVAGWALVVVTDDPTQPVRNLVVGEGAVGLCADGCASDEATVSLEDLAPAPAAGGPANVGLVAYGGRAGITGDSVELDGTALGDVLNPVDDVANATIGDGTLARDPSGLAGHGIDVDRLAGVAAGGVASATIRIAGGQDRLAVAVVTFQSDAAVARLTVEQTVTSSGGPELEPGDALTYRVVVRNDGTGPAGSVELTATLPETSTPVDGSLALDGAPQTDRPHDDLAGRDAKVVTAWLGSGASAGQGGSLAPGARAELAYTVRVPADAADASTLANLVEVRARAQGAGVPLTASSTRTDQVLTPRADLELALLLDQRVDPGTEAVGYTAIANKGPAIDPGPQVVTITLPVGLTYLQATGAGWSCQHAAGVITCTSPGALAPGAGKPAISFAATTAAGELDVNATVTGAAVDPEPASNSRTARVSVSIAPPTTQPPPSQPGSSWTNGYDDEDYGYDDTYGYDDAYGYDDEDYAYSNVGVDSPDDEYASDGAESADEYAGEYGDEYASAERADADVQAGSVEASAEASAAGAATGVELTESARPAPRAVGPVDAGDAERASVVASAIGVSVLFLLMRTNRSHRQRLALTSSRPRRPRAGGRAPRAS